MILQSFHLCKEKVKELSQIKTGDRVVKDPRAGDGGGNETSSLRTTLEPHYVWSCLNHNKHFFLFSFDFTIHITCSVPDLSFNFFLALAHSMEKCK